MKDLEDGEIVFLPNLDGKQVLNVEVSDIGEEEEDKQELFFSTQVEGPLDNLLVLPKHDFVLVKQKRDGLQKQVAHEGKEVGHDEVEFQQDVVWMNYNHESLSEEDGVNPSLLVHTGSQQDNHHEIDYGFNHLEAVEPENSSDFFVLFEKPKRKGEVFMEETSSDGDFEVLLEEVDLLELLVEFALESEVE